MSINTIIFFQYMSIKEAYILPYFLPYIIKKIEK